jgi:phosphonate transport system permease protein
MPMWSSFTLYRLETNVRSATALGIVGAGGIGQTPYESIRSFQYADTAAQVIPVVVTVIVIDIVSARIRKTLKTLVWWFGSPLHSCRKLIKRTSEPKPH